MIELENTETDKETLEALRDMPCETKKMLQNWLKTFLKVDLPDYTLDPNSNCNPMEMVWKVYKNMVWYNDLPKEERCTKFLFYATRGGFKCVSKGTYIYTWCGMKKIEDICPKKIGLHDRKIRIYGKRCFLDTSHILNDGEKDTLIVTLKNGLEIECTPVHPLLYFNHKDATQSFKKSKELKIGDYLVVKGNTQSYSKNKKIRYKYKKNDNDSSSFNISIPKKMDWNLGYFLGLIIGDGCVSIDGKIIFSNIDKDIIKKYKMILMEYFNIGCDKVHFDKRCSYIVDSIQLYDFLIKYCGMTNKKANGKEIPKIIFTSSKNVMSGFISGYIDSDGCIAPDKGHISITSASKELLTQLQLLLLNLGINSHIKYYEYDDKKFYKLAICTYENKKLKSLGIELCERKNNYFINSDGYGKSQFIPFDGIGKILKTFYKKISKKIKIFKHIKFSYLLYTKKYYDTISEHKIKELLDELKQFSDYEEWKTLYKLVNNDFYYIQIENIRKSKNHVYDFHVPSEHLFCSNGFISHNTLNAAMIELLALLHDERGTSHIAAGESHVKHCYNDYFQPFVKLPFIRDRVESSIMEKTKLKGNDKAFVEIMPCTKQRVQGSHNSLICKDEIDVVQNISAYEDIDGIPVDMPDKRPPITFGISVRKSCFGLVQREIDEAPKKGVSVYHWNLIDITERCPDERSGIDNVKYYVKKGTLQTITEDEFIKLPPSQMNDYDCYIGKDKCLTNCKLFSACRGLLKKQKSQSTWLKSIEYTEQKFTQSSDEQMIIAQFLCQKPPATGLIYSDYSEEKNEKTYSEMWEIFKGETPDHEITREELVAEFHRYGIPCFFGIDWGYEPDPTVALAIFIDKAKNIYVVDEYVALRTTEAEASFWLKNNWEEKYKPECIYPDSANPSGRRELEKQGFNCAGPKRLKSKIQKIGALENIIKDVKPGISSVRKFLRIPATTKTKIFIHRDGCPQLCYEIARYHNEMDVDGKIKNDTPAKNQPDHACDAFRYVVHSVLSVGSVRWAFEVDKPLKSNVKLTKAPTPSEIGRMVGIPIRDNSHILKKHNIKNRDKGSENDEDYDYDEGGFNFTF